jgi:hypothetical protein
MIDPSQFDHLKSVDNDEKGLRQRLEELRLAEVDVPAEYRKHATPAVPYPGQAFEKSYEYALTTYTDLRGGDVSAHMHEGFYLVHGYYFGKLDNAWVELPGELVFDATRQRFYRRDTYYQITVASPMYKYDPWGATCILRHINKDRSEGEDWIYGGWDRILTLPKTDPKNPTIITMEDALRILEEHGYIQPTPEE